MPMQIPSRLTPSSSQPGGRLGAHVVEQLGRNRLIRPRTLPRAHQRPLSRRWMRGADPPGQPARISRETPGPGSAKILAGPPGRIPRWSAGWSRQSPVPMQIRCPRACWPAPGSMVTGLGLDTVAVRHPLPPPHSAQFHQPHLTCTSTAESPSPRTTNCLTSPAPISFS